MVDPPLIYSSYLGGSGEDLIRLITEDSQGRILVCGQADAIDFPVTVGGLQPATAGDWDGFLACIDPTLPPANQLVFSTYFGGTGTDNINSICELPNGTFAFSGGTQSLGLPTTPGAFQSNHAGGTWDGMYGVIDATGATLLALTYFGGSGDDGVGSIAVHPSGLVAFCGGTDSTNLPIVGAAFQVTNAGGVNGRDGMYGLIDASGTAVIASSYLGGSGDDWAYCGDMDANGVMAISGGTVSTDFPVSANAFQPSFNGGSLVYWWAADAYVALIDPLQSGSQQLVYGSYFGSADHEDCYRARFASNGDVVIMGTAQSASLPTTANAHQQQIAGGGFITNNFIAGDAYVGRLDPTASGPAGLVYCTYVGGNQRDQGLDFDIDSDGVVTLCGWTQGINGGSFSTTPDAMRRTYALNDGYVARLSADGSQLLYATLLGGTNHDGSWFIDRHADQIVNVGSVTFSSNYPTVNPAQATFAGTTDAVVTRMRTIPVAVTRYGSATPSGSRKPTIHAMDDAVSGNANFGLACSKAPANGVGVLAFAVNNSAGVPVLGMSLFLDPAAIGVMATVTADANGESVTPIPLPAAAFSALFVQYVWIENFATVTLSASDALQLF